MTETRAKHDGVIGGCPTPTTTAKSHSSKPTTATYFGQLATPVGAATRPRSAGLLFADLGFPITAPINRGSTNQGVSFHPNTTNIPFLEQSIYLIADTGAPSFASEYGCGWV